VTPLVPKPSTAATSRIAHSTLAPRIQRYSTRPAALNLPATVQRHSLFTRFLPIVVILSYLGTTVVLFAFGPWQYPVTNAFSLYMFLSAAHLALLLGYWSGISKTPAPNVGGWPVKKLVWWSALANLILLIPTSYTRTGSWIPDVAYGLTAPGDAYADAYYLIENGSLTVEYIRVVFGPLLVLLLPLAVFYWPKLNKRTRLLSIVGIVGALAISVASGKNKVISETVFSVPLLIYSSYKAGISRFNPLKWVGLLILVAGSVFFFVAFFGSSVSSRNGSSVKYEIFHPTKSTPNHNNFLVRNLNDEGRAAIEGLDLYLTQGYYAVSLALSEPFVPMWGIGNSPFLTRQVERITGNNQLMDKTYPARIERYGWSAMALWNTAYLWIASDVSFPGTLVVVFLIGRLFAKTWLDTLLGTNPLGTVLFFQVWLMLLYFPTAAMPVQSGEGLMGFWVIFLLWWKVRHKKPAPTPHQFPSIRDEPGYQFARTRS
jgi:hypothetical protein